jgi:hypothetical protein
MRHDPRNNRHSALPQWRRRGPSYIVYHHGRCGSVAVAVAVAEQNTNSAARFFRAEVLFIGVRSTVHFARPEPRGGGYVATCCCEAGVTAAGGPGPFLLVPPAQGGVPAAAITPPTTRRHTPHTPQPTPPP